MSRETEKHLSLKQKAKELLIERGFSDEEIYFEYNIPINKKNFYVVDVLGKKENKMIAIECGLISNKDKIEQLKKLVDEVIHIHYERDSNIINPITIKIDDELWEKFKFLVPRNITMNEAVVELIKKHILENKK